MRRGLKVNTRLRPFVEPLVTPLCLPLVDLIGSKRTDRAARIGLQAKQLSTPPASLFAIVTFFVSTAAV